MQAMYLMVAAVVGMQQPIVPPTVAPALAQAQAALQALDALDALDALHDAQDPTDSLWRAARRAFNRADYASAAKLYGELTRRYPDATRAGDALYWAAFALYKNDDLVRARSLLITQQERYAKAATLRDGYALLARIQTALAKQGDGEAAAWLTTYAQPAQPAQPTQPTQPVQPAQPVVARGCPDEDDEDDMRIAALNGLLQMDATNALPILKKVLAKRDACSAGLRRKAVFIVSQKSGGETENILLDVARNDPDSDVRQQAVFWLSQVGSDRAVTALDSILRSTTDPELREKALFSLSQINNARAGQILRDYAANERAPGEAREKAIFWLGQSDDPRAAQVLLEIINP